MQNTARQHEKVPDRVMMPHSFERKKDNAERVGYAAADHERDRLKSERGKQRLNRKNAEPAHHQIRNDRKSRVFFAENEFENDARDGNRPDQKK